MKARLVSLVGDDAQVLVTPSWLARLFGARPYALSCRRFDNTWMTATTRRFLPEAVLNALDRQEVAELPKASVGRGQHSYQPRPWLIQTETIKL